MRLGWVLRWGCRCECVQDASTINSHKALRLNLQHLQAGSS